MSYSFSTPRVKLFDRQEIRSAVRKAATDIGLDVLARQCECTELDIVDHVNAIEVAAGVICQTIGEHGDYVKIQASGHAEPGHSQRVQWAPEHVSLSIQVERRPADSGADLA